MDNIDNLISFYKNNKFEYELFLDGVKLFFEKHPELNQGKLPVIHSIKYRLKDPEHLKDKLQRKISEGRFIDENNLLSEITDLAGVRVLYLYQDQFPIIHKVIMQKTNSNDWILAEQPKAYTWDPESEKFFTDLGLSTEVRDTYYTSIHYLIKPNNRTDVCCEVQVRTLFEEIWGEINHTLNYPYPTGSIPCKEQLRVLSKLVSTGTRLADSIFRSHMDYLSHNKADNIKETKA